MLVHLGQAIRQERQRQGISESDLATKAGVGKRLIARLEAGEVDPDYELLLGLARALSLKPATLIGRAAKSKKGWRERPMQG